MLSAGASLCTSSVVGSAARDTHHSVSYIVRLFAVTVNCHSYLHTRLARCTMHKKQGVQHKRAMIRAMIHGFMNWGATGACQTSSSLHLWSARLCYELRPTDPRSMTPVPVQACDASAQATQGPIPGHKMASGSIEATPTKGRPNPNQEKQNLSAKAPTHQRIAQNRTHRLLVFWGCLCEARQRRRALPPPRP